ncbi:hypothetical protein SUBVAR_06248 [Subdoligranulum variabile DSM 15176]|uniref:Uncharacterized protein n=1 Tax=Subdoligranulum variabile DSM 15176 TaxID=411471 RepID=D1PPD3_9FIRM|nr:hypothetical protein SUBVAR_06248 [Subdoligranulum variabile DSM 15176]
MKTSVGENERKIHAGKWNYVVCVSGMRTEKTDAKFRNNMQDFGINIRYNAKIQNRYTAVSEI